MRRTFLIIVSFCIGLILQAQVSKTVNVTAGGLSSALTSTEKTTVTNLVVTGTIDARDFKTMRDEMTVLSVLDISGVAVAAYTGAGGTFTTSNISYPANTVPVYAFFFSGTGTGKTSLKVVTLPLSITTIGSSAFDSCNGLTSFNIPSSVTSIGSNVFYSCTSLSGSLTIPSSVLVIGSSSFSGIGGMITVDPGNPNYSSLDGVLYNKTKTTLIQATKWIYENFIIPSSVETIGAGAFDRCYNLAAITIPSSVTSIEYGAFLDCSSLKSISIPSSVTNIGTAAFFGCTGLTSIYAYRITPVDLSSRSDVFYNVNKSTCTLIVPGGSKTAYQGAVQWNDFVNIVEIGAIVSKSVVATAGTLSSILTATEKSTITNLTITGTIDARDFKIMRDNMPILSALDIGEVTISGYTGTGGTAGTTSIVYPANTIPVYAFSYRPAFIGKTTLTTVNFPSSVTSIGSLAFYGCKGLTSIAIPSSVTSISDAAFRYCTGLISATLPEGLSTIGESAFSWCSSLTSITIPSSVSVIERDTFTECNSLATVIIQNGVKTIGEIAFMGCIKMISVNIPSSVTSIGEMAFAGCEKLISVNIPSSVTSIGDYAFMSCGLSGSIIIPDLVTLGDYVFLGCNGITEFIVNTTSLNYSDINGVLFNKGLTSLIQYPAGKQGSYIIPGTVSSIKGGAFFGTAGLSSTLTIPESVSTIGMYAFAGCSGLTSIYAYAITPVDLSSSDSVFAYINKTTCTLYVPIGSKGAYQAANQWKNFNNVVEFFTTDIELINSDKIIIYPNPVNDNLTLKIGITEVLKLRYQLYDINGNLLQDGKVEGNETSIDMSNYVSSTYFLKVTDNNKEIKTFKIIKN
jgi:hypothetical protein